MTHISVVRGAAAILMQLARSQLKPGGLLIFTAKLLIKGVGGAVVLSVACWIAPDRRCAQMRSWSIAGGPNAQGDGNRLQGHHVAVAREQHCKVRTDCDC